MNRHVKASIPPCAWRRRDGSCRRNAERQPHEPDGQRGPLGYDAAEVPHWDSDSHTLRLGTEVVKQLSQPAPNQERILAAFEEAGWAWQVDDPLPPDSEVPPKDRSRATIWAANRHQNMKRVGFFGDGTGEGICWALICRAISARDDPPSSQWISCRAVGELLQSYYRRNCEAAVH